LSQRTRITKLIELSFWSIIFSVNFIRRKIQWWLHKLKIFYSHINMLWSVKFFCSLRSLKSSFGVCWYMRSWMCVHSGVVCFVACTDASFFQSSIKVLQHKAHNIMYIGIAIHAGHILMKQLNNKQVWVDKNS
jgi:hypothetical protein